MRSKGGTIIILLVAATASWAATDLGTVGEVYPVVEPDIRRELRQQAARSWEAKRQAYREKLRTYQPFDLHPLPKATRNRSYAVDMRSTLNEDLTDQDGRVLYPKGYTFNPLDFVPLSIGLVVIDASDPAQVEWFKASPYSHNHRVKLLLSGGSAQALIEELHRAVFYLNRDLAQRLQLSGVPCVAVQQERQLQVTEFLLEEE